MTAGPAGAPGSHPSKLAPAALLAQCDIRFTRRSGPGGQNRNKVETAAILTHRPTGISAEANEKRSQAENRESALFRLRVKLALSVRSEAAPPSDLWKSRCRGGRIAVNPAHEDFPALLAEAVDALAAHGDDLRAAGVSLGVSPSQLARFLKDEPRAFAAMNDRRKARNLRPIV